MLNHAIKISRQYHPRGNARHLFGSADLARQSYAPSTICQEPHAVSWLDKLLAKSSKPPEIEIPTWRAASAMGDKQKRSGQESRQITSPIQAAVLNRLGDPGGLEPQPWWPSLTRYPAYDSVFHLTRLFFGEQTRQERKWQV
jgi:hypothetical protein